MLRKAQASMEFLMTYGWAILVVIIIVAILFSSGIIGDPTALIPEKCEFYITVICLDHLVEKDQIQLSLLNIAERDINVQNIIATSDALEGQCALTGLHLDTHLKNGEDFLFKLDRTPITEFAPPIPNNNWNLPNNQILLTQADRQTDGDDHAAAHELYDLLLNEDHIENIIATYFAENGLEPYNSGWWSNKNKAEFQSAFVNGPSDGETLADFKAAVSSWFQAIIDSANARDHAAHYVSTKTNESSSVTKDNLWNNIAAESELIFSGPQHLGPPTLEEYATDHSGYAIQDSVRLGCEDIDTFNQSRLDYAAYQIFINAQAANDNPSLSGQDLYDNLSRTIAGIKAFYGGFTDDEEVGVNEMASRINGTFKNPPVVNSTDQANLVLTHTDNCRDGFTIDEITLRNFERSDAVLNSGLVLGSSNYYKIIGKINEGVFGNDAFCALSIFVSDITNADNDFHNPSRSGSNGVGNSGRDNFDNDGFSDPSDTVDFFEIMLSKDRLTELDAAVDAVAAGTSPDDYRYSEDFNDVDLQIVLKMIQSEKGIIELTRISHKIIEIIFDDDSLSFDTLDPVSKEQLIDRVINDPWSDVSPYYSDRASIDSIIDVIGRDDNIRIGDRIIETIRSEDRLNTLYYRDYWLNYNNLGKTIRIIRSDPRLGLNNLDFNRLNQESTDRIIELVGIIYAIFDLAGNSELYDLDSDSAQITNAILTDPNLNLRYYSNSNSIETVIELILFYYSPPLTDSRDGWKFNALDSDSITELFHNVANPDHNNNAPLFNSDIDGCFDYPDDENWKVTQDQNENPLAFYLNTLYDSNVPNSKLYTREYYQEAADTTGTIVSLNPDLYYEIVYDALVYAAALNVSNADNPDAKAAQAAEIKKGVNRAANIFLFALVTAPYEKVSDEYVACYDTTKLFPDNSPEHYVSNCMAGYVKDHFENFNYQDVIDADLDDAALTVFLTNNAQFYLNLLQPIRQSVSDTLDSLQQAILLLFPTPNNVCEAAKATLDHPEILSNTVHHATASKVITDARLPPDCQNIPPATTIFKIINDVADAAGAIIGSAQKDRDAATAVKEFVDGWFSVPPLDIHIYAEENPVSPVFEVTVEVTSSDSSRDFNHFEIKSESEAGNHFEMQRTGTGTNLHIQSSVTAPTPLTLLKSDMTCQAGSRLSCSIVLTINAVDHLSETLYLIVTVIDPITNPDPEDTVTINVPDQVLPVVQDVRLTAVTPVPPEPGSGEAYYTELEIEVTAINPDPSNPLDSIEIRSGDTDPATRTESCPTGGTSCVISFTLKVPKDPNDPGIRKIVLTAIAHEPPVQSEDFLFRVTIPSESIPGCTHIDLGKKKNRYNLQLIYNWVESPGIPHTITGTLLANSPDLDP